MEHAFDRLSRVLARQHSRRAVVRQLGAVALGSVAALLARRETRGDFPLLCAGGPPCPAGCAPCAGVCTDTSRDPLNCGGCGVVVPPGGSCQNGVPVPPLASPLPPSTLTLPVNLPPPPPLTLLCAGGLTACAGVCVSLATDPANCGACGHACPSGLQCCSATCVLTQIDPQNCGACGHACSAGENCCRGTCQPGPCCTADGYIPCGDTCCDSLITYCAGGHCCPYGTILCGGTCCPLPFCCNGVCCAGNTTCVGGVCQ